jgi:hypothetical protein
MIIVQFLVDGGCPRCAAASDLMSAARFSHMGCKGGFEFLRSFSDSTQ